MQPMRIPRHNTTHLCEHRLPKRRMARCGIQSADALLERQQGFVYLCTLQARCCIVLQHGVRRGQRVWRQSVPQINPLSTKGSIPQRSFEITCFVSEARSLPARSTSDTIASVLFDSPPRRRSGSAALTRKRSLMIAWERDDASCTPARRKWYVIRYSFTDHSVCLFGLTMSLPLRPCLFARGWLCVPFAAVVRDRAPCSSNSIAAATAASACPSSSVSPSNGISRGISCKPVIWH